MFMFMFGVGSVFEVRRSAFAVRARWVVDPAIRLARVRTANSAASLRNRTQNTNREARTWK
jgi:hypothetical protein